MCGNINTLVNIYHRKMKIFHNFLLLRRRLRNTVGRMEYGFDQIREDFYPTLLKVIRKGNKYTLLIAYT